MKRSKNYRLLLAKYFSLALISALFMANCKVVRPDEQDFESIPILVNPTDTLLQIVNTPFSNFIGPDLRLNVDIFFDDQVVIDTFYAPPSVTDPSRRRNRFIRSSRNFGEGFCITPTGQLGPCYFDCFNVFNCFGAPNYTINSKWRGRTVKFTIREKYTLKPKLDENGKGIPNPNFDPKDPLNYSPILQDTINGKILYEENITFPLSGSVRYHILNGDNADQIKLFTEVYERRPPADLNGNFKIRVFNLVDTTFGTYKKNVTVNLVNGKTLFNQVPFGTYSDFVELPFGTHLFDIIAGNNDRVYSYIFNVVQTVGITVNFHYTNSKHHVFTGKPEASYTIILENTSIALSSLNVINVISTTFRDETDFITGVQYEQYGKLQILNAHPDYSSTEISINGANLEGGIQYGKLSQWQITPQGEGTLEIKGASGEVLVTNTFVMPPNGQLLACVVPDQKDGSPKIVYYNYPQAPLDRADIGGGGGIPEWNDRDLVRRTRMNNASIRFLNLSPDAGQVTFKTLLNNTFGNIENYNNISFGENLREIPYYTLGSVDAIISFGVGPQSISATKIREDAFRSIPPQKFAVFTSTAFPGQSGELLETLDNPVQLNTLPAFYTVALVGYRKAGDNPTRKAKLIIVNHSN